MSGRLRRSPQHWSGSPSPVASPRRGERQLRPARSTVTPTARRAPVADLRPDDHASAESARPVKPRPLRAGEQRMTLTMPDGVHAPPPRPGSAPTTTAASCSTRSWPEDSLPHRHATAAGQPRRRAPRDPLPGHPDQVAAAQAEDDAATRRGLDLLRRHGLDGDFNQVDDATWLGAWAPGGRESVARAGVRRRPDARVADRHAGPLQPARRRQPGPVVDADPGRPAQRRADPAAHVADARAGRAAVPVRARRSPLCDRDAAVADVKARFGDGPGLHQRPAVLAVRQQAGYASAVTSCTRRCCSR